MDADITRNLLHRCKQHIASNSLSLAYLNFHELNLTDHKNNPKYPDVATYMKHFPLWNK